MALYSGFAAPEPGRARRAAASRPSHRRSSGVCTPPGLEAPTFDGFSLSYHREPNLCDLLAIGKMNYNPWR